MEKETTGLACAICESRKEKRFCPAVHDRICPQCCGNEREVTLDCPSDCPYLQQARKNELPRDLAGVDPEALLPEVEVKERFLYEREPLIAGLTFAVMNVARRERGMVDRDVLATLTSLARSYLTSVRSGLVVETPTASPGQQALLDEVQKMLAEYRKVEAEHVGHSTLKESDVLQALVFLVRMGHAHSSGRPKSRAFLDFVAAQFPEPKTVIASPGEGGSRIVRP